MQLLRNKINILKEEIDNLNDELTIKKEELIDLQKTKKELIEKENQAAADELEENDIGEAEFDIQQIHKELKLKIVELKRLISLLSKASAGHVILSSKEQENNLPLFKLLSNDTSK